MSQFLKLDNDASFVYKEKKILKFWKKISAFKHSIKTTGDHYVFYDGPPFATGLPHYGHFVSSIIKDIIPRYWTMRGKRVKRYFGWDTHGLPIEMEVEKQLGLSGPNEIKNYGIKKFNEACRSSVLRYAAEWQKILTRLGRWVDFDNGYKTMDLSFMESVWWVFGELWKKGLVYKSVKVMPYSYRLATPLSNFESNLDYRNIQDPAIIVKLDINDDKDRAKLLIWTTTPWTLPSNLAVAVGRDIVYVKVKKYGEVFILAKKRLHAVLGADFKILSSFLGKQLLNIYYKPLFNYFINNKNSFKIVLSNHVNIECGTGLVHIAPAYGIDDFKLCKKEKINIVDPVDSEGNFKAIIYDFAGCNIRSANSKIINKLKNQNSILKHETIQHSYPFCWRSGEPLIYKIVPVWMIAVTKLKKEIIFHNKQINWIPKNIGTKRFENWLKDAKDWSVSRNRFWGTPIPIWECKCCTNQLCISSINELEKHAKYIIKDLHSHNIDHIKVKCNKCCNYMKRISEVFDCWFDSGSMPYAQHHYPFKNVEKFKNSFPAQFVAEGLDQTRGWFYTLLVLSTALFDKPPFENVIVNGLILSEDGSKMSKSKQNFPDVNKLLETYGADSIRAYLINSPVVKAEPLMFYEKGIQEIVRTAILPLYNAWSFFVQYANIDNWNSDKMLTDLLSYSQFPDLDRWILSKLNSLIKDVNIYMEKYFLYKVIPEILKFIDDLTNWYIRISRRRFWKNVNEQVSNIDKNCAYTTLYNVLITFAKILAPIFPFISEQIYQNLVVESSSFNKNVKNSIHFCKFPQIQNRYINKKLEYNMNLIKKIVHLGRALRKKYNIKLRQPLESITILTHDITVKESVCRYYQLIISELNIKKIKIATDYNKFFFFIFKANFRTLGKVMGSKMNEAAKIISKFGKKEFNHLKNNNKITILNKNITFNDVLITRKPKDNIYIESDCSLSVMLNTNITIKLIYEGIARELVSIFQKIRKLKGFYIDDRVNIILKCNSEKIIYAIKNFKSYIKEEVLIVNLKIDSYLDHLDSVKYTINNQEIKVKMDKF